MSEKIGESWIDKLDNSIAENSKLSLFLISQFVIIAILVIGYMKMIDKIQVSVELPKTIKEDGIVLVGKEHANELFYRMWGREDIEQISEFNHRSIKEKMHYLQKRMYPPIYYKYEKLLKEKEAQISDDLVSQKFTFAKEDIITKPSESGRTATVYIEGFYDKYIDEELIIKAQPCEYKLSYKIEGGHMYVDSYKTTCN